ncbi:inner membrane protein YiaA [Sphingobacterium siyangense]|uniref:inner membrane protein YiaA n=1 Tax=Sphingobacterium siyangense TaxID=459529 RepID=UPI003DA560E4
MEPLKNMIEEKKAERNLDKRNPFKPTGAFIGASWTALLVGTVGYCVGLWNATMALNEKGYYFTILLFAVISVQKSVRDKAEGLAVTELYYGLSWFATIAAVVLLTVGLWNADLLLSEKGFYAMSFSLSIFSAIAVQKNTRDAKLIDDNEIKL